MTSVAPSRQAGLTLIEVMIAVALFSLIGLAGFTLVQSIIGVEQRTDHRLDGLSDLQRTMHLLTSDFEQIKPGTLALDGSTISFQREIDDQVTANISVRYDLKDATLQRTIIAQDGQPRAQSLIQDVEMIKWQFLLTSGGWVNALPPHTDDDDPTPVAIALDLQLSAERPGHGGLLRRVVAIPRVAK